MAARSISSVSVASSSSYASASGLSGGGAFSSKAGPRSGSSASTPWMVDAMSWPSATLRSGSMLASSSAAVPDSQRAVALLLQGRGEDRRQQPAGRARRRRGAPPSSSRRAPPAGSSPCSARSVSADERQAEPEADQRLRHDRPAPAGARQQAERGQPAADQHGAGGRADGERAGAPAPARPAAKANSGMTVTVAAACSGDSRQPSISISTSRNSAAVSAAEMSAERDVGPDAGPPGGDACSGRRRRAAQHRDREQGRPASGR